jgi:hypothetical protein
MRVKPDFRQSEVEGCPWWFLTLVVGPHDCPEAKGQWACNLY